MTEAADGEGPVRYSERGPVAVVTLIRPRYRNAQNSAMTYALDAAFARAVNSPEVAVIVLAGEGEHFCAGHDIGTPGRDVDTSFDRQAVLWWDHVGRAGADARYAHPDHRVGEKRVLRGDDQVAGPGQHQAASDAGALDHRDSGLGHFPPAPAHAEVDLHLAGVPRVRARPADVVPPQHRLAVERGVHVLSLIHISEPTRPY